MINFQIAATEYPKRYTVTCDTGLKGPSQWRCHCRGFTYRKDCRHIHAAQKAIAAGVMHMTYKEGA